MIGQQTAEEIKLEIGSAFPLPEEVQAEVRGRDLVTGLPKTVVLTSEEVRGALEEPLSQIIGAVKETLDRTPPELASDIMDRGIMLAGGGALLQGLDERLRDETQMPCHLAESPLTCVAVGSGRSLEEFDVIHRASKNSRNRRRYSMRSGAARTLIVARLHGAHGPEDLKRTFSCTRSRFAGDERCLALLVSLSIALLTVYFGESASGGLHAIQRGFLEVLAPLQEGASRALKPARDLVGWTGDVFDAKSENKDLQEAERGAARAGSPRPQTAERDARQLRALVGPQPVGRLPGRATTTCRRARDRALADGLVLGDHDRQGLRPGRARRPAGRQRRRPRRAGVRRGAGRRARHADHRPHAAACPRSSSRTAPNGLVKATVGNPNDLILDFVREGPRRAQGRDRRHLRAGARRGSSRCSRAASRSDA